MLNLIYGHKKKQSKSNTEMKTAFKARIIPLQFQGLVVLGYIALLPLLTLIPS